MDSTDSSDLDEFPYVDEDDYRNLEPIEQSEVEFITLHELLTILDGKQQ